MTKTSTRRPPRRGQSPQLPGGDSIATSVKFTSPERVLFPDIGLTKMGLAAYYAQVADWMLPHLINRPLSVVRCPEGSAPGKCFYQKHARKGTPAQLRRVEIEEKDGVEEYVMVDDRDALLSLVQMNVLEIHPWGSQADRLDHPDRMILDLDPDAAVPWPQVIEAARTMRGLLQDQGLESFVKTTGGKGLHVVAPISPRRQNWEEVKAFTRHMAEALVATDPSLFLINMSKAARKGKIFVDYLRNDRGSTAIANYSTRARASAPVSVPLAWKELSPKLRSDHFRVDNLIDRLRRLKTDPWEGFFEIKQTPPRRKPKG